MTAPTKARKATTRATKATVPAQRKPAPTCQHADCDKGVRPCPGCHGHGRLRFRGGPFRKHTAPANILPGAPVHEPCKGSGKVACGCRPLAQRTAKGIGPAA